MSNLSCTRDRVRKKCGPKRLSNVTVKSETRSGLSPVGFEAEPFNLGPELHILDLNAPLQPPLTPGVDPNRPRGVWPSPGASDLFESFKIPGPPYTSRIPVEILLQRLQIYQTWFYAVWPVLSVADLILTLLDGAQVGFETNAIELTESTAMPYALCCAVCAAITTQISFVSMNNLRLDQEAISAEHFALEAKRVRNLFDYTAQPDVNTLLSSFFLYAHYVNNKGRQKQSIMYLREAISMAQILGFHEEDFYQDKSRAEIHRWRKIFYTLMVTERYTCFEDGMPVILDPCVEFPDLADEEYPNLLHGFSELIRVFSVPNKQFFFEMNQQRHDTKPSKLLRSEKEQWIWSVQNNLKLTKPLPQNISNLQKLNILLSRSWIRAIACHIISENGMLRPLDNIDDCFGYDFPLKNATDFLAQTLSLPDMAFESNGPGVCVKLLEMSKSLCATFEKSLNYLSGLTVMENLFQLVNRYKNDVSLPTKIFEDVGNTINLWKLKEVPRLIAIETDFLPTGTIEELLDDDEVAEGVEEVSKGFLQPFLEIMPLRHSSSELNVSMNLPQFSHFFGSGRFDFLLGGLSRTSLNGIDITHG